METIRMFESMNMDFNALPFIPNVMSAVFAFTAAVLVYRIISAFKANRRTSNPARKGLPQAGGAWPILGHLPHLVGPDLPHVVLANMADKYGPIFTIRQGVYRTVVISSSTLARECFTVNDRAFANRPKLVSFDILGYSGAMFGLGPYNDYWRYMRKITTVEFLSTRRLEILKHVRESELKSSLKRTFDVWLEGQNSNHPDGHHKMSMDMKTWFGDITVNLLFRMIVSERLVGDDDHNRTSRSEIRKVLRRFMDLAGAFVLSDALPFLRWLDLGGQRKAMKKVAKILDQILDGRLNEHKEKAIKRGGYDKDFFEGEHDFMDVMLSSIEKDKIQQLSNYDVETVIKATCLSMLVGGTDTTAVTLTWALCLLLNHPEALKKAQEELDMHVGRERAVNESDLKNLVYLQAILKETMRLYPAGPLTPPHESLEDCTIGGFHIPAGTRLVVNLKKLHTDPQLWTDPFEFQPERFLTSTHKDVDVKGQNFELIPFGSGRRMCPGISFALQVMQPTLANLLHLFDVVTPSNEAVDMTEQSGLSNMKATPLQVLLSPRLPLHIYKGLDSAN